MFINLYINYRIFLGIQYSADTQGTLDKMKNLLEIYMRLYLFKHLTCNADF